MKQITKKLNSNAGASMILALSLMLVCIIVSSIIVSTASSGLSRTNQRTTQQRDYLAISSAAELIAEELEQSGKYVATKEKHLYGCQDYVNSGVLETITVTENGTQIVYEGYRTAVPLTSDAEMSFLLVKVDNVEVNTFCTNDSVFQITEANPSQLGSNLQALLKHACEYVMKNSIEYKADTLSKPDRGVFYLSAYKSNEINVDNEEIRLPKVKCELEMDTNYNITIRIYKDGNPEEYIEVFMKSANISEKTVNDSGATTTTTCKNNGHKVLNIDKDGNAIVEDNYKFETINDCSTIEISWQKPVIVKGGN